MVISGWSFWFNFWRKAGIKTYPLKTTPPGTLTNQFEYCLAYPGPGIYHKGNFSDQLRLYLNSLTSNSILETKKTGQIPFFFVSNLL